MLSRARIGRISPRSGSVKLRAAGALLNQPAIAASLVWSDGFASGLLLMTANASCRYPPPCLPRLRREQSSSSGLCPPVSGGVLNGRGAS